MQFIMNEVIGIFTKQKSFEISTSKRIEGMYEIIRNKCYGKRWSKSDRLLACEFIKKIINED